VTRSDLDIIHATIEPDLSRRDTGLGDVLPSTFTHKEALESWCLAVSAFIHKTSERIPVPPGFTEVGAPAEVQGQVMLQWQQLMLMCNMRGYFLAPWHPSSSSW
jgi:hypothetical protein